MRVIAGKARRLNLKTVDGMTTRPTTDRIKETLFNMINVNLQGAMFLDLFAGSGQIGIEALSRGAKKAYFIDSSKECVKCIKENLVTTKLADDAVVSECDVITGLRRLEDKGIVFDYIFMDPPYDNEHEKEVLAYLINSKLIDEYTTIIVEASLETDIFYAEEMGYTIDKIKEYKTNKHVFLEKR